MKKYLYLLGFSLWLLNATAAKAQCTAGNTLTTATGTITDGSGTANYQNNANCSWLIQPAGATAITINFTAFATEQGYDFVTVYNGTSATGTLIGTYSGTTLPAAINIPSGNAFITFTTDGSITAAGFSLSYTATVPTSFCSGLQTLTTPTGTISDGSGTSDYLANANCSWLIQPAGATAITINFTAFATEQGYDFVTVYNGTSTTGTLIGTYSGTTLPAAISVPSGNAFITFTSDGIVNAAGFSLNYTATVPTSFCSGLQTLTTPTGTISDGSGTSDYQANANCSWLIQPAGATAIAINFTAFATELNYDFVTIYNGTSATGTLIGTYSGTTLPAAISVPSGNAFITFTSDGIVNAAGFSLNYTATVPAVNCSGLQTLTASAGTITDGSGAVDYPNNANCSWLIQPAGATAIAITFTDFNTESGYDFVKIYNGINATGTLLATYSGTTLPAAVTVPSGNAFITFTSDGSVTGPGFSLNYTTPCANPPAASINPPSPSSFCSVSSITLSAGSTSSGVTYSWSLNGAAIPNSNSPTYTATAAGTYQLTVSTSPNCLSTSNTVNLAAGGPVISVTASADTICPGGSSQLIASTVSFTENCDDNITTLSLVGGVSNISCGSFLGNAFYFNDAIRSLTTPSMNVSTGGTVSFYLEIASGTAPCEAADPGEDVILQYSLDNGTTWVTFGTYAPGSYNTFTQVSAAIPAAAYSSATLFRWTQNSNSGVGFDNWAIDEISISNVSGNYSYTWTPPAGLSSANIANPVCNTNVTRTYTVTVSDGSCSSTGTITIVVTPAPPASITASGPTSFCPGGSVTLTASNGTAYNWSNGQTTPSITVSQSGNYTVTVSYGSGCSATSSPFAVSLTNAPNAAITNGGNNAVCNGSSVNLIGNLAAPTAGQWYRNGLLIPNATSNMYAANQGGQYYMIQTNALGCSDTSNVITITDNTPVALITATPDSICPGGTSQLNVLAGGFSDTFDGPPQPWVINGGITNSNVCGSVSGNALTFDGFLRNATTPSLNVTNGGTVSFYLEIASGTAPCEQADAGEDVTLEYSLDNGVSWTTMGTYLAGSYNTFTQVNVSIPVAAMSTSTQFRWSQFLNSGTGFDNWAIDNVNIQTINTNYNYSWSPAAGLSSTSISNPIATLQNSATYNVTLTNNGCSAQFSTTVVVTGANSASISSAGNAICPGDSLVLTASQAASYLWSNGATTQSIQVTAAGSYGVSVTYPGGCTSTATPIVVSTGTAPTVQVTGTGNNTICGAGSIALTANTNTGNTLQWYLDGFLISGATGNSYNATQAGTYTVNATNTGGCSTLSNPLSVISNNPEVMVFADPDILCGGGTTQLVASAALMYENFDDSLYNNLTVVGGASSLTCGSAAGNALYFDGGIERSLTTGNVNATLVASVSVYMNIASGTAPCEQADAGEDVVLEYSVDNGTTWTNMFTYLTGSYNAFIYTTVTLPAAAQTPATRFRLRQLAFSGAGFDNWTIDDFTLDYSLTGVSYSWTPAAGLSATNVFNPTATVSSNTIYTVTATAGQCSTSAQMPITVVPSNISPNASITQPTCPTCCDGSIVLLPVGGTAPYFYIWTPVPPGGQGTSAGTGLCDGVYNILIGDTSGCSNNLTVTLSSVPTGLQAGSSKSFGVYPNPFADRVTVELEQASAGTVISVVDVLGKTLKTLPWMGSRITEINTEEWAPGIYMIEVRSGSDILVKKIHKK